jgi:1-phosphatidylinositol-4-phosphate 5-kinase
MNIEAIRESGESQGKSGSFFFFSYDNEFIVKTMEDEELDSMLKILKDYHLHCEQNRDSLLARIYGLYSVMSPGTAPIHIYVMQNINSFRKKVN